MLQLIADRDGWACWLCGLNPAVKPSIDHALPSSIYPHLEWSVDNWRVACFNCNAARGNRRAPTDPAVSARWARLF